jgi:membrane protein YqaA with SNARE-associated domain
MAWVKTPYGQLALFLLAFAESSFFPIPPDVFLIAMSVSVPMRAFRYAAICAVGSTLGGAFGYALGLWFMDIVGLQIIDFYGLSEKYALVGTLYQKYDIWAVGAAGFTPLPYKLFTIAAGAFKLDFLSFIITSFVSRSLRFFLIAAILWRFGAIMQDYIERYFNLFAILLTLMIVGGFVALRFL